MRLSVKAPAKINLTLDVLSKRDDGYHDVATVMTTVDLADRIDIELRDDDNITLECPASYVPNDERNHAYQAAKLLMERYSVTKGVNIYIDKQIPVAAGLAGGSSNAAATIRGLNELWNLGLNTEEMAGLGAEIGSDVPFCVYGGTAVATGRGEQISLLQAPPNCWVVLAKPMIGVSTAEVFKQFDPKESQDRPMKTEDMVRAIEQEDFAKVCSSLGNHLELVTFKLYPRVHKIKEHMLRFGGEGVLMSGSGPTIFALVQKESKANRLYNGLKGFCKNVYVVRMLGE